MAVATATQEAMGEDLRTMAKMIKTIASNNRTVMNRMEAIENMVSNVIPTEEDEDFDSKDRKKALSRLADNVINPDDALLPQMTETPDSMIMPMVVKHAQNEFLKIQIENPDSKVLFSDLLMKWCDIKMRARHRALIGEAMGFSQIEIEKQIDDEARGLEAQAER